MGRIHLATGPTPHLLIPRRPTFLQSLAGGPSLSADPQTRVRRPCGWLTGAWTLPSGSFIPSPSCGSTKSPPGKSARESPPHPPRPTGRSWRRDFRERSRSKSAWPLHQTRFRLPLSSAATVGDLRAAAANVGDPVELLGASFGLRAIKHGPRPLLLIPSETEAPSPRIAPPLGNQAPHRRNLVRLLSLSFVIVSVACSAVRTGARPGIEVLGFTGHGTAGMGVRRRSGRRRAPPLGEKAPDRRFMRGWLRLKDRIPLRPAESEP
jgi:hypothetical protein